MRALVLVALFALVSTPRASAQEGPPPPGTEDAPPELVVPAIPEGYVLSVRAASNEDRRGPGPGEIARPHVTEEIPAMRASDPVDRFFFSLGGGAVAVGAAIAIGYAIGLEERDDEARWASTLVFAYMLTPTFTWLAGSAIGGGAGNMGGAFVGESIGLCIGGLFAWWAMEERSEEGVWTSLLLVPALGAIFGLEVQHELRVAQHARDVTAAENEDVVVSMSIAPTAGGGLAVVSGRF